MSRIGDHLMIAPVVLPLLAGGGMLLLGERRRGVKAAIGVASTVALVGIAVALIAMADAESAGRAPHVGGYRPGGLAGPVGIVLCPGPPIPPQLLPTRNPGGAGA